MISTLCPNSFLPELASRWNFKITHSYFDMGYAYLWERSQMTSWGGSLEKKTQDVGEGGCWAKDDVTFYMIVGKHFKQFDFKKLVLLFKK